VLRSCEKEYDDDSTDDEYETGQSQRQDEYDSEQPRLVRRLFENHTRRNAVVFFGADRPQWKRGDDETGHRQRRDDQPGSTSCRQCSDFEWLNDGDQSLHGDRYRYPRRQQLTAA